MLEANSSRISMACWSTSPAVSRSRVSNGKASLLISECGYLQMLKETCVCQGSGSQSREKVAYNYEFPKKSKAKQ